MHNVQEKQADRIARLLRKAESTQYDAEAESLVSKAQELMAQYAVDQALVEAAKNGDKQREEIVREMIVYKGRYKLPLRYVGYAIAEHNGCRPLLRDEHVLVLVGFETDVSRAKMLDSSLQVQCIAAMWRWWKDERENHRLLSEWEKHKARRQFCISFADGLEAQLTAAVKAGREEASRVEAERSGITQDEAAESVALVIRSREDRIQDWFDREYGDSIRSVSRSYAGGSSGRDAGYAAGRSADIGRGVGGAARGIEA